MSPQDVLRLATTMVRPSKSESVKLERLAGRLLDATSRAASAFPETRGVVLGGSYAKGTWLPGEVDLDIFVRFDPSTPLERFESAGLAIGERAARGYPRGKMFAQHPYTEATVDGVKVNVVPCFAVERGHWLSAADRSPFHVEVVKTLSKNAKLQMQLLKLFMKGVGVYGAEIRTQGFSGYVAEVLAMKRGGLLSTLRWFAGCEITDQSRPFSLPDPVDEARDLGVAVSPEKLGTMILASRDFLRAPSLAFFRGMKGIRRKEVRVLVYALVFSHKKLSEDILWGELRKTMKHLVGHVESHGFKIARSMAASDNDSRSAILLIPEFAELPKFEQRVGPTVDRQKDLESFLAANEKETKLAWVDDDARARVMKPRAFVRLEPLLESLARGRLGPTGASEDIAAGMKKTAKVLSGPSLAGESSRHRWLETGILEITSDAIGTRLA